MLTRWLGCSQPSALCLIGEAPAMLARVRFGDRQESARGMRERHVLAVNDAELTLETQLWHGDVDQVAALDLLVDGYEGQEGHAVAGGDELLDRFDGRQFDIHVQRNVAAGEGLKDLL